MATMPAREASCGSVPCQVTAQSFVPVNPGATWMNCGIRVSTTTAGVPVGVAPDGKSVASPICVVEPPAVALPCVTLVGASPFAAGTASLTGAKRAMSRT
jgi:hypothetical protein